MKFSTLLYVNDEFRLLPGATFHLEGRHVQRPWQIANGVCRGSELEPPVDRLDISNELLVGPESLVSTHVETGYDGKYAYSRFQVTLLKAAVRMGPPPMIVSEAEAGRCEIQHQAHAVWVPNQSINAVFSERTNGQLLMKNFAILTQGDVLNLRSVERGHVNGGMFKQGEPFEKVLWEHKLIFDGTNLRFLDTEFKKLSQESYV